MPNSGDDLTGGSQIQPLAAVPEAFVPLAEKINELVAAANAANIGASAPIKIVVGDNGKLVALDLPALSKMLYSVPVNTPGTGGTGGGGDLTIEADELHFSRGSRTIDIDNSGIYATFGTFGLSVNASTGVFAITNSNTGKSLTIDYTLLTHDMTVREIDVCDAGVAKKMLVLGSAPY